MLDLAAETVAHLKVFEKDHASLMKLHITIRDEDIALNAKRLNESLSYVLTSGLPGTEIIKLPIESTDYGITVKMMIPVYDDLACLHYYTKTEAIKRSGHPISFFAETHPRDVLINDIENKWFKIGFTATISGGYLNKNDEPCATMKINQLRLLDVATSGIDLRREENLAAMQDVERFRRFTEQHDNAHQPSVGLIDELIDGRADEALLGDIDFSKDTK